MVAAVGEWKVEEKVKQKLSKVHKEECRSPGLFAKHVRAKAKGNLH